MDEASIARLEMVVDSAILNYNNAFEIISIAVDAFIDCPPQLLPVVIELKVQLRN